MAHDGALVTPSRLAISVWLNALLKQLANPLARYPWRPLRSRFSGRHGEHMFVKFPDAGTGASDVAGSNCGPGTRTPNSGSRGRRVAITPGAPESGFNAPTAHDRRLAEEPSRPGRCPGRRSCRGAALRRRRPPRAARRAWARSSERSTERRARDLAVLQVPGRELAGVAVAAPDHLVPVGAGPTYSRLAQSARSLKKYGTTS